MQEVQRRHAVIRKGGAVLDLGCCPGAWLQARGGAWLQVACQALGPMSQGGCVVGVDIQPTAVPQRWCDRRVRVIQADALALSPLLLLRLLSSLQPHSSSPSSRFTTLLSDMFPSTSGASPSDVATSHSLALRALALAAQPFHKHSEPHSTHSHHHTHSQQNGSHLLHSGLHTFHPSPPESFDARPAHPHPSTHNRSHPDPAYPDTGGGGSRGTGAREPAGEAAREAGAERAAAGTECVAAVVERPSARVQGAQQVGGRSAQGCGEGGAAAQGGVLAVGGHMVVKLLEGDDTPGTVVGGGGQWWAVVGSGGQYGDAAGIGGRESGNTPCEEVNGEGTPRRDLQCLLLSHAMHPVSTCSLPAPPSSLLPSLPATVPSHLTFCPD
ncbi:unnamed protein product [Closterium sp. NIES-65]|nr:unnamed protein product [Closterium sp. NIES-65]